jgi:hypothetical protein
MSSILIPVGATPRVARHRPDRPPVEGALISPTRPASDPPGGPGARAAREAREARASKAALPAASTRPRPDDGPRHRGRAPHDELTDDLTPGRRSSVWAATDVGRTGARTRARGTDNAPSSPPRATSIPTGRPDPGTQTWEPGPARDDPRRRRGDLSSRGCDMHLPAFPPGARRVRPRPRNSPISVVPPVGDVG